MRKRLIAITALAPFISVALADSACAQSRLESGSAIQPGTEFPAAPMSKGGFSLSAPTQVIAPAPPAPIVTPPPEPEPKKRRKRRR